LAIENRITLICLIPHSTHALQPLDVGVFKPAKTASKKIVKNYYEQSGYAIIDKQAFPALFKKMYESAFFPQHAVAGFHSSGLYPLNCDKVTTRAEVSEVFNESDLGTPQTTTPQITTPQATTPQATTSQATTPKLAQKQRCRHLFDSENNDF
jgi:hypothetical protein